MTPPPGRAAGGGVSRLHAGAAAALAPGTWKVVVANGVPIVVLNCEGTWYAFLDRCPHAAAPLSLGRLRGDELTCARHGWSFDVTTGASIPNNPAFGLKQFPVVVDGGELFIVLGP
ncbi:MAG: Rieske (2Fe-2S) protein [Candidatus Omnitrophica bacterium]|nr:Rieske (2Fe-2S) protein [Candidatus Omnitrophota bacterium]